MHSTVKRLGVAVLVTIGAVAPMVYLSRRDAGTAGVKVVRGNRTVGDCLEQYGRAVRKRLEPYFEAGDVSYPPERVVLIGLKQERQLEMWACGSDVRFVLIRTYPILGASGRLGPKLKRGDYQVPEGLYRIESLNPNSRFHLSLRVNYPNEFDRAQARRERRADLGGDIMIHGGSASIGCVAVGDEAAEDLFVLAAQVGVRSIHVVLSPVDFRRREMRPLEHPLPAWTNGLYQQIGQELSKFRVQ